MTEQTATPAADESLLGQLRTRRTKKLQKLTTDILVPRWDEDGGPKVFVRFKPVDKDWIDEGNQKASALTENVSVSAAAYIMAKAAVKVFALADDGTEVRLSDQFDQELSEALGLDATDAIDTVRSMYFYVDGDLIAAMDKLTAWSGYGRADLEREYRGN